MEEEELSSKTVKELKQLLAAQGIKLVPPPLEKQDYIDALLAALGSADAETPTAVNLPEVPCAVDASSERGKDLRNKSIKELKLMLATSGIVPAMPPVEKQDFIDALLAAPCIMTPSRDATASAVVQSRPRVEIEVASDVT